MTQKSLLVQTLLAVLIILAAAACESEPRPIGKFCNVMGENTFLANDPCEHKCLDTTVTCPFGERVPLSMCSGEECTATGNCPRGQVCVRLNVSSSWCVPAEECG